MAGQSRRGSVPVRAGDDFLSTAASPDRERDDQRRNHSGSIALIILPTMVVGNELLIPGGVGVAVGGWFP